MRVRQWDETWSQRVFPTPDQPLVINKGEVVLVVTAASWEEAADVLRDIGLRIRSGKTDG